MAMPNLGGGVIPRGKAVLLTGGYDHTIRFWEVHSGLSFRTMQYPDSHINLLRVSPDRKFFAVAGNPHVRIYKMDMSVPTHIHQLDGHTNNVTAVTFLPNSDMVFTASEDSSIKGWDLRVPPSATSPQGGGTASSTPQREMRFSAAVNAAALHPARPSILASGDASGHVRLWDLAAAGGGASSGASPGGAVGGCLADLCPDGDVAVRWVCFSPDGSLLAAVNNAGSLFAWNLPPGPAAGGRRAPAADPPTAAPTPAPAPAPAPAEGGDAGWAIGPPRKVAAHGTYALRCLVSPDGRRLATASADHSVKLWWLPGLEAESTLAGHQKWVWDLAFSADSSLLFSASSDNTARCWNVAQAETVGHFTGHHKALVSLGLCDAVAAA